MEIAFTKVALPFGWLGNMSPHKVIVPPELLPKFIGGQDWNPIEFRTAEAAFQALRFVEPIIDKNLDIFHAICREKSPMGAKMVAKKNAARMIVVPRSKEDVSNMLKVLTLKLEQHPKLKEELLETDGPIIEDCSNRRNDSGLFWGAAKVEGEWIGHNNLGKLWVQLRGYCRHEIPFDMIRRFGIPSFYSGGDMGELLRRPK